MFSREFSLFVVCILCACIGYFCLYVTANNTIASLKETRATLEETRATLEKTRATLKETRATLEETCAYQKTDRTNLAFLSGKSATFFQDTARILETFDNNFGKIKTINSSFIEYIKAQEVINTQQREINHETAQSINSFAAGEITLCIIPM